ncbi:uncharacterized protein LOC132169072 [Corylus avellana]|uniref:uncharacterized protein LOC132169072 n=1 Tax=Corylus avellana TaxID=13451 RepID=UPI00286CAB1F|nr:uncharacterized protein LOC132169072 [Corylus avellana]
MIQSDDTPGTVSARMAHTISKYNPRDVEILLGKWCTPDYQAYCQHMKDIRKQNEIPHYTGSKSLARVAHEEFISSGKTPTRAVTYIKSHTKSDGSRPNPVAAERIARMEELLPNDPAEQVEGPQGTIRWTPDDAYAQAHNNKPEYAGRVRGVSKNILPAPGTSYSYYTPSQTRSQNRGGPMISREEFERAMQSEREKHRHEMDERLTQQSEEITASVTAAVSARVAEQVAAQMATLMAAQMAAYEARIRSLEGSRRMGSDLEVTTTRNPQDAESPARVIVRSSVDSRSDDVRVEAEDDHNDTTDQTPVGQKSLNAAQMIDHDDLCIMMLY